MMQISTSKIKGEALLTIGYTNFSHVTIVFIAKYLFTGSVKILNKIVFKMQSRFFKQRCLPQKEKTYLSSGNYKTCFIIYNSLLSCLSCQNHFMFLNHGQHVDVTDSLAEDEGELLFLFDTQCIQREESSFQEKCMDFHVIHPGVAYDRAHVCIS